jgi:hypothetical protein
VAFVCLAFWGLLVLLPCRLLLTEFMVGGLLSSEKCFLFYYALYPDLEEKMLFDLREMFASHDCQVNVLSCISLMLMLWFILTCTLAWFTAILSRPYSGFGTCTNSSPCPRPYGTAILAVNRLNPHLPTHRHGFLSAAEAFSCKRGRSPAFLCTLAMS